MVCIAYLFFMKTKLSQTCFHVHKAWGCKTTLCTPEEEKAETVRRRKQEVEEKISGYVLKMVMTTKVGLS